MLPHFWLNSAFYHAGTTFYSLHLEGANSTTRAPSAGWRTTWTTRVSAGASGVGGVCVSVCLV